MAIMIREYISSSPIHYIDQPKFFDLAESSTESKPSIDENSIMVEIEGIHAAPFATRNYTRYMPQALKSSIPSWTKPYRRPLIKHHNEKDGEIIGRIWNATYETKDTFTGTPAIRFFVNVPGEKAINEIKNGILATTSIGVIAHDVRCSICGQHLESGDECEHERGHVYDGETCYWDIYDMEAKELSYVIVPSDSYSKTIAYYPAKESSKGFSLSENVEIEGETSFMEKTNSVQPNAEALEAETLQEKATMSPTVTETATEEKVVEVETVEVKEAAAEDVKTVALKERLTQVEAVVADLKEQLKTGEELRESLEDQLAEAQKSLKAALAETITVLREALGKKEMAMETIVNRTEDSIRDSIADMKEELTMKKVEVTEAVQKEPAIAESIEDPTLHQEEETKVTELAESHIDLKEELHNIFGDIISAYK